jgi:hypothetical protein
MYIACAMRGFICILPRPPPVSQDGRFKGASVL